MAAIQLSDARTKLGLVLKDISDISDDQFLYMCQTVSDYIYPQIFKTDPEKFIKSTTVNITAGTNNYSLPADYMTMNAAGTGLYRKTSDGYETDQRWTLTGYGKGEKGYYLDNSELVLTPDNYPSTETAVLRYLPNPPAFSGLTDYFTSDGTASGFIIIDSQYMHYLVSALQTQYMIIDEDSGGESLSDFRFVRAMSNLLANVRRTGGVYITPDLSQPF